jgi:integrase
LWNAHLLAHLGELRLREIDVRTVMRLRADLEAAGGGRQAIRKSLAVLQSILQRAVEWQRIGSNPVRAVRKPTPKRVGAVDPIAPLRIEAVRARLLAAGRLRDATLVSVLAYAGVRPQEALALEWRHVRERTLLVEQALSDGALKAHKTRRPPRTVDLLGPLRQDLAEWQLSEGRPTPTSLVFQSGAGGPWREHDWRNWRRRVYAPVARSCGIESGRPYDLRHSFASLLIHEGRHSIVDIAQQLGHDPNTCLSTYAHVMAELRDADRLSAEEQIRAAREEMSPSRRRRRKPSGPDAAQPENPDQLRIEDSSS